MPCNEIVLSIAKSQPLSTNTSNGWQVNLIMANEITPHLTAEEYMDKGEYENELKQVIGDTKVII